MCEDKVRAKKWKCNHCCYINQKIMVGGLYRLYNQSSRCGLCGDLRNSKHVDIDSKYKLPEMVKICWEETEYNKENKQSSNDVPDADPLTDPPVVALSENKIDDIECNKEDKIPIYSPGVYISYTEEKPLYTNLKDEITNFQDELSTLVPTHQFEEELSSAKIFVQTTKWKNYPASRTNKKYGIIQNQPN
eukprot:174832_1